MFKQVDTCDVRTWTPMAPGALDECGGGGPMEPAYSNPDTVVLKRTKKKYDPKKDGLYLSCKITEEASNSADNHFILRGKIVIFMLFIEIDFTIKPGTADMGGGMFLWGKQPVLVMGVPMGYVEMYVDVIPLDFDTIRAGMT